MSPRREFLFKCSALAAAAVLVPLGAYAIPTPFRMKDLSLDELSFTALAAQVNSIFRVRLAPAQVVELELTQANLEPDPPPGCGSQTPENAKYERFSLVFCGPKDQLLDQRIHKFEHDRIGRFEMFIVPVVARDTARLHYEAVFNRPARSTRTNV